MKNKTLCGKEVNSMHEIRGKLTPEEVRSSFLDRSLETWLESCCYEIQYSEVEGLNHDESLETFLELSGILNLGYEPSELIHTGMFETKELEHFNEKLNTLRKTSFAEKTLKILTKIATTQTELARLLEKGEDTIYLCGKSFNIPIKKGWVHYIGIDEVESEAPYTKEQYGKAGITFENVKLPTEIKSEYAESAKYAAVKNGYDDFAEKHNSFAAMLHKLIKGVKQMGYYSLGISKVNACERYDSKYAASSAGREIINKYYAQAKEYFDTGSDSCIAKELASKYSEIIKAGCKKTLATVDTEKDDAVLDLIAQIKEMSDSSERELTEIFETELRDNSGCYDMYDKSYFLENFSVEEHDFHVDTGDSFWDTLGKIIGTERDYTTENLLETVIEMEEDVNKRADLFYSAAFDLYKEYCGKIESVAQELGDALSKKK